MGIELILPFLRPIEPLLLDESISEIVGNLDASWWHERDGIMRPKETISFDASKFRTSLEVIANQLDNKLDEDNPLVRAQFPDRSRPAAVIPPVVRPAVALTITKFACRDCTIDELIARGIPTLGEQVSSGKTLPISYGMGTGRLRNFTTHIRRTNMPQLEINQTRCISPSVPLDESTAEEVDQYALSSVHSPTMSWTRRAQLCLRLLEKTVTSRTSEDARGLTGCLHIARS